MSTRTVSDNDDSGSSTLARALKLLTLRSISPSKSSSTSTSRPSKPLPRPPPPPQQDAAYRREHPTSLPPYLAHLAEPSTSYTVPPRFPEPLIPRSPPSRPQAADKVHARVEHNRLPPRPPAFVSAAATSSTVRLDDDLPDALKPGPIAVSSSSAKPAYPWELVPQRKSTSPSPVKIASHTTDKEYRIVTPSKGPPPPTVKQHRILSPSPGPLSPSDIKTPPRRANQQPSPQTGSLTPNGSRTDKVKGQCLGIKKDGTRCTRKFRSATSPAQSPSPSRSYRGTSASPRLPKGSSVKDALVNGSSDEDSATPSTPSADDEARLSDDDIDEWFCHQHAAEAKKWPGFYHRYARGSAEATSEVFTKYDDWINTTHIDDTTQALLRNRMSRNLTDTDRTEQGHLYIHELLACSTATHICLKVGRSIKVFRRIGEWNSQCRSKQPLLRAIYPSDKTQELMPGMDTPTMEGVQFSRQWEALVHLELAGIGRRANEECHDCGRRHREIFMIPRKLGQQDGYDTAKKVILKWLRFVQMLADPDSNEATTATAAAGKSKSKAVKV
ncbi:conserved hypothetical protein [Sporisorium reilianum SRZ2]|uniref:Bacteriophage T5 Orf172 DNA-binding domain-containing protein n=1 Tax=Sporisorium reilianum (strain SRZ2) TaxID=999809 RepID=E6ZYM7_SPORE|nr:conserved hypothetical protein [Sporisorium reilianum SRZ2]